MRTFITRGRLGQGRYGNLSLAQRRTAHRLFDAHPVATRITFVRIADTLRGWPRTRPTEIVYATASTWRYGRVVRMQLGHRVAADARRRDERVPRRLVVVRPNLWDGYVPTPRFVEAVPAEARGCFLVERASRAHEGEGARVYEHLHDGVHRFSVYVDTPEAVTAHIRRHLQAHNALFHPERA